MSDPVENASFTPTLPALLSVGPPPVARSRTALASPVAGITLDQMVLESAVAVGTSVERTNHLHVRVARPAGPGPFPALLLFHGGHGYAEEETGKLVHWAGLGFVALTLDLPGIADPAKTTASAGRWRDAPYGEGRWTRDPCASTILDGVTAAWHGLHLLRAEPGVDRDRIGLSGISWGGYMATMIGSLAGETVRAVFSTFGCAYYDRMLPGEQMRGNADVDCWRALLDPSHRLEQMHAPYFVAAATNDFFFWPPGVEATLAALGPRANHVYAPNADHQIPLAGGTPADGRQWCGMERAWFEHWLNGRGAPFPRVVVARTVTSEPEPRAMIVVDRADRPLSAQVFYTTADGPWRQRAWRALPAARTSEGLFEAVLPSGSLLWFALVTDGSSLTVSSRLVDADGR